MLHFFAELLWYTMTVYESQLAFLLLEEYFGPVVTRVCEPLKWGPKTLKLLVDPVHSPPSTVSFLLSFQTNLLDCFAKLMKQSVSFLQVKQALSILINFNFVGYKSPEGNPTSCDYSLNTSNILQMFRYPKYVKCNNINSIDSGFSWTREIYFWRY